MNVLFALGLTLALQSQDGKVLTLDEALKIAEAKAFSLRIQESQVEVAKAQEKVSKAQLNPGAQVSSTLSWFNARTSGGFGANGSQTNTNVALSVSQIIDISGVYRNRIRSAEFARKAQEFGVAVEENSIRGLVKAQYFGAVQTKQLIQVQTALLESANERLAKARIREQEGDIPRFDVLRLEVDVKKAEQARTDAEGEYLFAKQQLNNLLGRPIETDFEVEVAADLPPLDIAVEKLVKAALQRRPEIGQSEMGILSLEQARKADEKAGRPTLTAGASHVRNLDPGFGQSNEQTQAQLTISVPIVVSGVVQANARSAKEREEQAKIRFEQLQLGIALEVQGALLNLATALDTLETARKTEELAAEALRLAQLRYDEGVGILLDVTTSQNDLTSAQANVAISQFRVRSAYADLQRAVGSDDLKAAVESVIDGKTEKTKE